MLGLGKKDTVKPVTQTYVRVPEELDFSITSSSKSDYVAAGPLRKVMRAYIERRRAIERCDRALEGVDLTISKKPYRDTLQQAEKTVRVMHKQIMEELDKLRINVQTLSESVFKQVTLDLGLATAEEAEMLTASDESGGPSISDQLLGDDNKQISKQYQKEQKQQKKECEEQAKDFLNTQKKLTEAFEKEIGIEDIKRSTAALNSHAWELEQRARSNQGVEREIPKQPSPQQEEQLLKYINREIESTTPIQ